jgi:hypothetical protein
VKSAFSAADVKLATRPYRSGVPIADVERAILLGSLRKCAAFLNNGAGTPITSLHYFVSLFDEVRKIDFAGLLELRRAETCCIGTSLAGGALKSDKNQKTK